MYAGQEAGGCRRYWTTASSGYTSTPTTTTRTTSRTATVYWDGDDRASVASLPDLAVIAGELLPRAARRYLRANVAVLLTAWRRLNP